VNVDELPAKVTHVYSADHTVIPDSLTPLQGHELVRKMANVYELSLKQAVRRYAAEHNLTIGPITFLHYRTPNRIEWRAKAPVVDRSE